MKDSFGLDGGAVLCSLWSLGGTKLPGLSKLTPLFFLAGVGFALSASDSLPDSSWLTISSTESPESDTTTSYCRLLAGAVSAAGALLV